MASTPPLEIDQIVVALGVSLPGIVFLSSTADPVNIPKVTALLLAAVVAVALWGVRAVRQRELSVPWGLPALAGAALLVAFTVSTLDAPQTYTALMGATGRNSGLWAYAAALILYFSVLRAFSASSTKILAFALLAAGVFTAVYGMSQLLGVDAIAWSNPFSPMIATLGNPDFASAYLGITAPVAAWGTLWTGWHLSWRIASGATAVLCLVDAALSSAVQGPIAAAAGLTVLGLAVTLDLSGSRRKVSLSALGVLAGLGVLGLGLGAAGIGPARSFFLAGSYQARIWYWAAAVRMWQHSPFTGIGMDSYGLSWWRDRPIENVQVLGGDNYSDSAHSVPLQHLAEGGVLLAAAYVLFVVVVSVALLRGLARLRGQERLLLAALGGAWVAYQVQSFVSIDQVPLLVLHFSLGAGVVVASGGARLRVVRLPGALPVPEPGRGRKAKLPRVRPVGPVDLAWFGAVGVAALLAMWLALVPLRANHDAHVGDVALAAGDGTAALQAFQRAVDLQPSFGPYRTKLAQTYNLGKRTQDAYTAFLGAWQVDKAEIGAGRTAGRLAQEAGNVDAAGRLFTETLAFDPLNSSTILDWAQFELKQGKAAAVRSRLSQDVVLFPSNGDLFAALGDAKAALGDASGARAAYNRALAIDPNQSRAKEGLKQLA